MINLQFEQATCKNSMLAWVSVRQPIDSPSDARSRAPVPQSCEPCVELCGRPDLDHSQV
jgi:hypothetical protein